MIPSPLAVIYRRMLLDHVEITQLERIGNTVLITCKQIAEDVFEPRHTKEWVMMEKEFYVQYELTPTECKQYRISHIPRKWEPQCSPESRWGALEVNPRKL